MILEVEESVELELPAGWRELPPASVLASSEDWLWEWVECTQHDCELREVVIADLRRAAEFAQLHDRPGRTWVVVSDPTERRGVLAFVVFTTRPAEGEVPVPAYFTPGIEPWTREVCSSTIDAGRLVSVHDVYIAPRDGGHVVSERYVGTLAPTHHDASVQVTLIALGMDSFTDIVAEGEKALARVRVV